MLFIGKFPIYFVEFPFHFINTPAKKKKKNAIIEIQGSLFPPLFLEF